MSTSIGCIAVAGIHEQWHDPKQRSTVQCSPENQRVQHHPLAGGEQRKHEPGHTDTYMVPNVGRAATEANQHTAGQV